MAIAETTTPAAASAVPPATPEMLLLQELLLMLVAQDFRKSRPRRLLVVLERFRAAQQPENVVHIRRRPLEQPAQVMVALDGAVAVLDRIAREGARRFGK